MTANKNRIPNRSVPKKHHVLVEHLGDIEVTAKLLRSVTNLNPHASSLSKVPVGRYSLNTAVNDRGKVVQLILVPKQKGKGQ